MFFIVGTGRNGSQTIAALLDQSPDLRCYHEPEPRMICESTAYAYGRIDAEHLRQLLRETRPARIEGQQYGESNHKLSELIPLLHETFPTAKFIWLLRDGRAAVASMVARGWYRPWLGARFRFPGVRQWEVCRIRGDEVGAMSWWEWHSLSPFEKCCWYWAHRNQRIKALLNECGAQWLHVRLEDLDERMPELFTFLGVQPPADANLPRRNQRSSAFDYEIIPAADWSPAQRSSFAYFCRDVMDAHYPGWRSDFAADTLARPGRIWRIPWNLTARLLSNGLYRVNIPAALKRLRLHLRRLFQGARG